MKNLFRLLAFCLLIQFAFLNLPAHAEENPGPSTSDQSLYSPPPPGWPTDAQSTTGPVAPPGVRSTELRVGLPTAQVVLNVPAYLWRNGCGPTAAGMVLGYYDAKGYGALVSGSATTETAAVDAMISSAGNINDYVTPKDSPPNLLPDKSEAPIGDEHPNNSLADFMKTSQSHSANYWGWSWFSDMGHALTDYVHWAAPQYTATTNDMVWGTFTWSVLKSEIDAGRPLVLLVDSNGDGVTDHFVPAIGYSNDGGIQKYAVHDTWDLAIHWYAFRAKAQGKPWGIYGATLFQISGPITPNSDNLLVNPSFELDGNVDGHPDNWTANAKFTRSGEVVKDGSFAGMFRAADNRTVSVQQAVKNLAASRTYKLSAWVNIPPTTDSFNMKIQLKWRNSANTIIRTDTLPAFTSQTSGWIQRSASLNSPAGTKSASLVMIVSSLKATIYVDNLYFGQ